MRAADELHAQGSHRRIFNHDIRSCTHKEVPGNHLYSGRGLALTEPDDVIQIHPFLKREWEGITSHYDRVGLSCSARVIWDVSLDRLAEYTDMNESVFFFGPSENRARADQNRYRVVEHINDKNNFMALASHLRLDVPLTQCFRGKEWFAGIEHFPYPCYVKAAVSVAGKGIHRCEDQKDVIRALAHFADGVPLQVQNEIKTEVFLNLQYEATVDGARRLLVTEQVLDGFTHRGNRYPASHEPWDCVEPMAHWLWEKGIKGIFAFDVGVVEGPSGRRFVPIECNPRFNGASYPSAIAARLQLPEWVCKDFVTRHRTLSDLDLRGLEFDADNGTGIILVNWGTIFVGKVGIMIAGPLEVQEQLEADLLARL